MMRSFVGMPEQVRWALMHGTRQRQRQHQRTVTWQVMLPKEQRNLVTRDCYSDAVGFATLRKAAMRQLVGIDFTAGPWPDSGAVGSSSLGLFLNFVGWGWRQQDRKSACAITACTT